MGTTNEITHRTILVTNASTGAGETGLTIGDFTVTTRSRTATGSWATYSASPALVELGSGLYGFTFTTPPSRAWYDVRIEHASHDVTPRGFAGQAIVYDADSLAALVARPTATLSAGVELGSELPLTIVARRYRSGTITVLNASSAVADLSGYTNLRLAIRNDTGSLAWESGIGTYQVTGLVLTGTVAAGLQFELPEDLNQATAWPATTAVAQGAVVQAGDLTAICTIAGTTAGTEPTWPTTPAATIADGTATWRIQSDPMSTLDAAVAAGQAQASLRYEITGDASGDAAKTTPLIRTSTLTIIRDEVATSY